jgi:hypothetical protein
MADTLEAALADARRNDEINVLFFVARCLAVLRLLGLRVIINAQRSIRPKNALWTGTL